MHALPLIYAFLNLIVLILFLYFALRKTIKASLASRREDFIKKSKESHDYYNSTIGRFEDVKSKIKNIENDGNKYLNTITENSKRIGEQMIDNAKKTSEAIIIDAGDKAAAELRNTRNTIVSSFVNKIVDQTRTKLKKDVDDAKRGEYIDEYSKLSKTQRGVQ